MIGIFYNDDTQWHHSALDARIHRTMPGVVFFRV